MKKKALIIISILLVILLIAGVGISIHASNNQPDPSKNEGSNQTNEGEEPQPEELKVDFFSEYGPFECNGDYTSFSYIEEVMNQDGTVFYSKSSKESGKHNNALMYILPNGEEKLLFMIGDADADVEVMSIIDDAMYFNISNSREASMNGLYRMLLKYNEAGDVSNGGITLHFNMNLEPMKAENNTILLRSGEQYYIFDTQTGECAPYN